MATTQITPNNYRLKNAIAFVNSFGSSYNYIAASVTGTLTDACNVISSISSNTGINAGQLITSTVTGIPTNSLVTNVTSTSITMSNLYVAPRTTFTGTLTNGTTTITAVSSTAGISIGQSLTSTTAGLPGSATVTNIVGSTITMSGAFTGTTTAGASFSSYTAATATAVSKVFTGTLTNACNQITALSSTTGISVGQTLSSTTSGITLGATVVSVDSTKVVMSSTFGGTTTVGATITSSIAGTPITTYNSTSSGYYAFAAQSGIWPGGVVPQYYDNPSTIDFNVYNNMLFGKSIQSSDVSLMVNSVFWNSGSIYDMYDDIDTLLTTKQFYVYTLSGSYYYVWKCLYNNNNAVSTYAPTYGDTVAGDPYYETADGYQWKYMYKISTATYKKFATNLYIPVVVDANVTGNSISGSVDVIIPVYSNGSMAATTGSGYNNYYSGAFSSSSVVNTTSPLITLGALANKTTNFYNGCYLYITGGTGKGQYKKIIGHASNTSGIYVYLDSQYTHDVPDNTSTYVIAPAVTILNSGDQVSNVAAIALVNSTASNSIYKIQVLNRGVNVQAAAAFVNVSTQVGVSNVATIRVIASPKGGHGSNVAAELYCSTVGISTTFANSESNTIPTVNDYQTIGILANPLFANVVFTTTGQVGTFSIGETVTQTVGNVTSKGIVNVLSPLGITNATGSFVVSTNSSVGLVYGSNSAATAQITQININNVVKGFRTFNQLYTYNGTYGGAAFTQNETVYQVNSAISNAVFHSNNAAGTTVYLTQKRGPIYSSNTLTNAGGSTFTINTKYAPDLVPESGDIIYIENFDSVTRSASQSETIKLILQY